MSNKGTEGNLMYILDPMRESGSSPFMLPPTVRHTLSMAIAWLTVASWGKSARLGVKVTEVSFVQLLVSTTCTSISTL